MKILITGANGFIGKNLSVALMELNDIEIVTFEKEDSFSKIKENINEIDFIFHLAGINRPNNIEEYYRGNTDLTKSIIEYLKTNNLKIPIVMTSSIQAINDSDYGKSKKQAEDILMSYEYSYIYRLHNVFGKWCKPNYNSVTATFCYNIAHNMEISITNPETTLELIYIDDIIREFISILNNKEPSNKKDMYCYIKPMYTVTLGELAEKIRSFRCNMQSILVPQIGEEFTKKLFSTYISYVDLDDLVFTPKMNIDDRGSFTELIRTIGSGQISISKSKPGVFRGNHYHNTKMEKFIVIEGSAKITLRHIVTNEIREFEVNDEKIEIVTIPVGYTHKIENIGNSEMTLLIWANEVFDQDRPDTYFREVEK